MAREKGDKAETAADPGKLVHELEVAIDTQRGVDVAIKLDKVIKADAWRAFKRPYDRSERRFNDFSRFIADRRGLGLTPDQLRFFCTSTPRILGDLETLIKQGGNEPPEDTSADTRHRLLLRLQEQRPDLHKRVLAGELSPYAAMIEAGFRRRTAAVPVDDVEAVGRFLQRRFTKGQIRKLIELLSE